MDKYRVMLTGGAYRDLDEIYEYVASDLGAPMAAERLVDELEHSILSLDALPYRGSLRRGGAYGDYRYRQLIVKNFTIIYRVEEDARQVIIVTVRYSKRFK